MLKLLGPAPSGSTDAVTKAYSDVGRNDGGVLYVTNGLHAVGTGMWTMPWIVPYNFTINKLSYLLGTAGSGTGTPTLELRKGSNPNSGYTAYGNGTIYALGSLVPQTGLSISFSAGDIVWPYITVINATTAAIGCMIAWNGVKT